MNDKYLLLESILKEYDDRLSDPEQRKVKLYRGLYPIHKLFNPSAVHSDDYELELVRQKIISTSGHSAPVRQRKMVPTVKQTPKDRIRRKLIAHKLGI